MKREPCGVVAMPVFMFIVAVAGGSSRIETAVKMISCSMLVFLPPHHAVLGVYAVGAFIGVAVPVIVSLLPDMD